MDIFKFECDQRVRDTVTGWEGTVTSRSEWRNGCIRYGVSALVAGDVKENHFDEDSLEFAGELANSREHSIRTGGARPSPPRTGL